ncbi:MAG: hypothetical protein EHM28_07285 [Spirochaetaceae bacterium]|nr:MAG: hypothetical protein EHM28_07285 [Spirochaetaceae bacterium]
MAEQLSVFMENKPGKIEAVTGALLSAGVNLRGVSIASRGDFGVLKLLPDNPEKARKALVGQGFTVSTRKVVIAIIDDKPGSLHNLLLVLSKNKININDCYGISIEREKNAAIVFDIEDAPEAQAVIEKAGIRTLPDKDIHQL